MPLLPPSASDATRFIRLNAQVGVIPNSNVRTPSYTAVPRFLFGSVLRASEVSKEMSPQNNVLGPPHNPPGPPPGRAGCLQFTYGPSPSYLRISPKGSLFPEGNSFTISFFMKISLLLQNPYPYIFSLNNNSGYKVLAVSIEGGKFSLWYNDAKNFEFDFNPAWVDSWHFYNIIGQNGNTLAVQVDGVTQKTITGGTPIYNIANTEGTPAFLNIGTYPGFGNQALVSLQGYLANFRWVVGAANTPTPVPPLPVISGPGVTTSLLLLANTEATAFVDSGNDAGNTVIALEGPATPAWSSQIVI